MGRFPTLYKDTDFFVQFDEIDYLALNNRIKTICF